MGFNLLAFAGGAAKGITEEIDKAEEEAKAYATTSTKLMYDKYSKMVADNKELVSSATSDLDIIKANYTGRAAFNEQQLYEIGINPAVRAQLVKAATDKTIDLSTLSAEQIVKMSKDNPSSATAKDRIAQAYSIPSIIDKKIEEAKGASGFISGFGARAGATASQKAAAALGVPLEQMRGAMQPQVAPKGTAEFDLSVLKAPQTNDAIVERADAAVTNTGMQFGKDSKEYKAAVAKRELLSDFIPKTAETLEKRASTLNVKLLDTTDPTVKETLQKQLSETQGAIKAHALAITAKTDTEKQKSYNAVKTSVQDYATNRMQEEYGASWHKFVSFKTVKLDDGTMHTSMSQKVDMPLEEQRKMYDAQKKLMKQALQDNKYVVDGAPIYESVSEVMRNFNIEGPTEPLVASAAVAKPPATSLGARPSATVVKPSAASAAPEAPMPPQTPVQRALGDKASLLKEIDLVNKGNDKPEIKKQRTDILGSELNKVETIIKGATPPAQPVTQAEVEKALAWANANPNDPRAAEIKKSLGK